MVWTHHMGDVTVHNAFSPQGSDRLEPGVPAISLGAGARWLEAYQALQPNGRYVQGGGCTSVGVAGFTLGGGFGTFSRRFGTAAGNLLEAEVVTASGNIVVANSYSHPELFWALRGGGFGLGVVTRFTMRTHEPPPTLGAAAGTIKANSADAYRRLIRRLVDIFPLLCDLIGLKFENPRQSKHCLERGATFPPLQLPHEGATVVAGVAQTLLRKTPFDPQGTQHRPERHIDDGSLVR